MSNNAESPTGVPVRRMVRLFWWYRPWNRVRLIFVKNSVLMWEITVPQYKAWWWIITWGVIAVIANHSGKTDHYEWMLVDA